MKKFFSFLLCFLLCGVLIAQSQKPPIWSADKANEWYAGQPWMVGCNFIPSSAINEIEMWQKETFDTATISRELGWAENIGMNVIRVFLHNIPWQNDPEGFKNRMKHFLTIAKERHIQTIFVLFDDCWNAEPKAGIQPAPKPGVHNSGWVQCPGKKIHNDSTTWSALKEYEKDILSTFREDKRIAMWDLYNEPGNSNYGETTMPLLKNVFAWAWEIRPSQPLTCGLWYDNKAFAEFQTANSDIISFHNYGKTDELEKQISDLQKYNRPLICTEYMARTRQSKFQTHLGIFKKCKVAAVNWGLVAGKTNTIYAWDMPMPDGKEPAVWFHDIFRKNGEPYDATETKFIKDITSSK